MSQSSSFPMTGSGQKIGLLGGSFDPAHAGHVHITKEALKRFQLDQLWWLVSPGNPLKEQGPAALERRMRHARQLMQHPRVHISDAETHLGTRYTAQTLRALKKRYRGVQFVWLMGADNLAQFHLWNEWRWIMDNVPVGVLARPGERMAGRMSPAAMIYRQHMLTGREAHLLGQGRAPAWCFVNIPMLARSSTAIRAQGDWISSSQ